MNSKYVPYYNNSDDSHNFAIAKGYSYHMGPVYNFFLKIQFLYILNIYI